MSANTSDDEVRANSALLSLKMYSVAAGSYSDGFSKPSAIELGVWAFAMRKASDALETQSAELASLRARCDAAEKDAERYTKFRKWWFKYWASPSYEDDVSEAKTEAALDKAIDDLTAQRAKEGETRK